jgi:hypothetical protein
VFFQSAKVTKIFLKDEDLLLFFGSSAFLLAKLCARELVFYWRKIYRKRGAVRLNNQGHVVFIGFSAPMCL